MVRRWTKKKGKFSIDHFRSKATGWKQKRLSYAFQMEGATSGKAEGRKGKK
jgi:hypothetical protein